MIRSPKQPQPQPRPLLMKNTIVRNDPSAKKKPQIRCTHCSTSLTIRNGTYPRNDPANDTTIKVQRYLCKSPQCPWQSFSILPKFILPVVRHSYGTILRCKNMINRAKNQADTAKVLGLTRGAAKRLRLFCQKFTAWFSREKAIAGWGPDPPQFWPDFTRDFSQSFFPGRWIKLPSTQIIHC